jgi:hypothetical protein
MDANVGADKGEGTTSEGGAAMPLLKRREIIHWRIFERIMDPFWIGMCIYISIQAFVTAPGSGGTGWFVAVLASLLMCSFAAYLVWRPIKFVFYVSEDSVSFSEYRCFGYVLKRSETIPLKDLGCLVVDTERICCGLRGFIGVYATRGLPIPDAPLKVAFQIPILYNGWTMNCMRPYMAGAYLNTFVELERAFRFGRLHSHVIEHTTTTTWTGGSWSANMNMMAAGHMDNLMDSLNSYEEYVSVNPMLVPESYNWTKERIGGRKVFVVEQSNKVSA